MNNSFFKYFEYSNKYFEYCWYWLIFFKTRIKYTEDGWFFYLKDKISEAGYTAVIIDASNNSNLWDLTLYRWDLYDKFCWFEDWNTLLKLTSWISQVSPLIFSPVRNFILSCTHLHCTSWLPFPYIHQIIHLLFHTFSLLTKSLLVELTQLCSRGLARQIYKVNNSVSFWDFLTR